MHADNVARRRAELADFLRRRRAALKPEEAGFSTTARRRTPGLRREEVAELAGISVALYTWLEQGRDVPVSARTIDAIADALRLSSGERTHVHRLVRRFSGVRRTDISPALRRMVYSLEHQPTFVLDPIWDVVVFNRAGGLVFGDWEGDDDPNMLEMLFTEPRMRELFVDWESVCESLVELFRLDFANYASDARSIDLIDGLRARSPLFAALWEKHGIREYPNDLRRLQHPLVGELLLEATTYTVIESPALRLLVFTPYDEETTKRIARLVKENAETETSPV